VNADPKPIPWWRRRYKRRHPWLRAAVELVGFVLCLVVPDLRLKAVGILILVLSMSYDIREMRRAAND
jgi:hypothetical protein